MCKCATWRCTKLYEACGVVQGITAYIVLLSVHKLVNSTPPHLKKKQKRKGRTNIKTALTTLITVTCCILLFDKKGRYEERPGHSKLWCCR